MLIPLLWVSHTQQTYPCPLRAQVLVSQMVRKGLFEVVTFEL